MKYMDSVLLRSNEVSISHGDVTISATGESAERIVTAVVVAILLVGMAFAARQLA